VCDVGYVTWCCAIGLKDFLFVKNYCNDIVTLSFTCICFSFILCVEKMPENITAAADAVEYEDDFEESEKSSVAASSDEGDKLTNVL